MKLSKIILTGILATALSSVTLAGNTLEDSTAIASVYERNTPQEIKLSELPQAVQETLKTIPYEGWKAERAWVIEKEDKTLYQIEVVNKEESTTLIFDEEGAAIG